MALTDTARLATVLTLKDGLTPGLNKPIGAVGKFGTKLDGAGKKLGRVTGQLKTAGAVAGGVFAGGLLVGIKDGLQNLGELESATTSVDAALRQMGKAGKVTAGQIADWANEIEAATDAAFDDKQITAATTTLLRFGKVTTRNIRPAMEVMTDLAAKTGDVDSAATLLAKALADPTKAAGRLTRAGIILTKAEQDQIKAFDKAGKTGAAQAVVLGAIERSTKGAAKAINGPYVDAQRKLSDAVEDGTKALAIGFLPIITKVSGKLQKALADPKVIANIKRFGEGLAGAFDKALEFAEKIPWGAIGSGLKTASEWAGKLFDAFRSLPPEAQATIVALAGLNKLSGGAVTGIVSELGKGLIKGVLGMTAGVVNIKAGTVTGGGIGGAGVPGGKGTAGKLIDGAGKLLIVGMVAEFADILKPAVVGLGQEIHQWLKLPDFKLPIPDEWPWGPKNTPTILPEIFGGNGILGGTGAQPGSGTGTNFAGGRGGPPVTPAIVSKGLEPTKNAITTSQGVLDRSILATRDALHTKLTAVQAAEQQSAITFREGERASRAATGAKLARVAADVRHSGDIQRSATVSLKGAVTGKLSTSNSRLAAIQAKRMHFTTNVSVPVVTNVSVRNVNNSNTTQTNYSTKTHNNVL